MNLWIGSDRSKYAIEILFEHSLRILSLEFFDIHIYLVFKKVTSASLNSYRQKGYKISVKNWIFDDSCHKKGPVLVILVPGMIQLSGPGGQEVLWWNRAFEALDAIEADKVSEAVDVLSPDKSLLRDSESSRFLNSAFVWDFEKLIFDIIIKYNFEF